MRIRIYAIVLVLLIIVPLAARAQTVADLQAKLDALLAQVASLQKLQQTLPASGASTAAAGMCPSLTRTLNRGMDGADVRDLQVFLKARGLLDADATGFFGPLTETAVRAFQKNEGIVSSGDAASTGFGAVGPKTRARIAALCADKPEPEKSVAPKVCPATSPQQSASTCLGAWLPLTDADNCHVGWKCVTSEGTFIGGPPNVEKIDGPLKLFVGETGTWKITARDPEGAALLYSITWGDEGGGNLLALLAGYSSPTFLPSSQFTHSYSKVGQYTPTITVRDPSGYIAMGSLSIAVVPKPASTSPLQIFDPGSGSCLFNNVGYQAGTESEGYNVNDLCLQTGGVCLQQSAYLPKFRCTDGVWEPVVTNPYPHLPTYANTVGSNCPSDGATKQVVVEPGTQLCRGLLCAIAKTYAPVSLRCQYVSWVDWGAFSAGATTTTVCAEPTPCEYVFGTNGRACAAKEYGVCKAAPYQGVPSN
jgi:peptidoglycan hydrolase-like protein with peptidoglycan-binding domain